MKMINERWISRTLSAILSLPGREPLNTSFRCFICLGLGGILDADDVMDVGPDLFNWEFDGELEDILLTTVFTLDVLGVGDSGLGSWLESPLFPLSPLSEDVVEPELTPLELWRTKLGGPARCTECGDECLPEKWLERPTPVKPLLMLPPRRLALSKHKLDAKIDARTLCLLPNRTEMKKWNVINYCWK